METIIESQELRVESEDGRAFYTTPQNLGQYLFVDFFAQKRKWIRT